MQAVALCLVLMCVVPLSATAFAGATAPRVTISSLRELPRPLPLPYDSAADAEADFLAAYTRARASGKRVLVHLGANWCPDCRILAGVMELPEVKPFIDAHFEVVHVDVGRFNKNMKIVRALKIRRLLAVPWVVIIDPDVAIVASSFEISDQRHSTPQKMVDWVAERAQ